MLTGLLYYDHLAHVSPKEGDIYKVIKLHEQQFELRYGYYEECEREDPTQEPMPIYPNFLDLPMFTPEGFPFVTKMQDVCPHFDGVPSSFSECAECGFYCHGDDLIGICSCPARKQCQQVRD